MSSIGIEVLLILCLKYKLAGFMAGRPKTALLFWFFGDFRYDVPLFIVILVIYKY